MKTNWQTKKLGEICEVFNGKTPLRTEQRKEGYPVLKIRNIDINGVLTRFESFVDEKFFNKFKDKTLHKGDILILNAAHTGSYVGSKKYYWDNDLKNILPTGEWTIIRAKDWITSYFIYLWALSSSGDRTIRNVVRGIHLYPKDVANLMINIPSEEVKQQIVERLDAIRKLQELNNKEIEKTEELFESLLTSFLKPKQDWQIKKLGDIAEISGGGTPPTSHTEYFSGEIPWFTPSEITAGTISVLNNSQRQITEEAMRYTKVAEQGTVLLSSRATIGNVGVVSSLSTYNQGIKGIKPNEELNSWYLAYWLLANKKRLERSSHGTTFKELSSTALRRFDILIPPLLIQQQIVERLDAIRKLQELKKLEKDKLSEFFESALNKAMKGELVT